MKALPNKFIFYLVRILVLIGIMCFSVLKWRELIQMANLQVANFNLSILIILLISILPIVLCEFIKKNLSVAQRNFSNRVFSVIGFVLALVYLSGYAIFSFDTLILELIHYFVMIILGYLIFYSFNYKTAEDKK